MYKNCNEKCIKTVMNKNCNDNFWSNNEWILTTICEKFKKSIKNIKKLFYGIKSSLKRI